MLYANIPNSFFVFRNLSRMKDLTLEITTELLQLMKN